MTTSMAINYRSDFLSLNHWEYFEFLIKQDYEEKKQLEDLCKIMEDRVTVEDQYLKGIDKIVTGLEQLNLKGSLAEFASRLIAAQRERISVGKSYLVLVRKDTLESIKDLLKKQGADIKAWVSEQKKLEKEYRSSLEKAEKLKTVYVSQAKECDMIGMEAQTMIVNREITSEKRVRATQKHIENIKQKVDNEESYQAKVVDHNTLLERFKVQLETFNKNLLEFKASTLLTLKQTLARFLDFDKTQSLVYAKAFEPLYSHMETVDTQQITRELAGLFLPNKGFPAKLVPVIFHSFFQQAWGELQSSTAGNTKEIITAFRSFHENVIKAETGGQIPADFEFEGLHKDEKDNIILISYIIDSAWRGEPVTQESIQKFQQLMREKLMRSIFVAGFQQYRLAGKFTLNESGFKKVKSVLYCFLDECLNAKDVVNTTKIMILSLTFWKQVSHEGKPEEKKYLQASVKWHPLWRDLDYWMAAIFMSTHEEVVTKRSYKLEQQESEKETRERQKAIVCGQLLSYVHNMASFGVEKADIKRIIKQYCQYYSLEEINVKEIMGTCEEIFAKKENTDMSEEALKNRNKGVKKTGFESMIRDFFVKRNSNDTNAEIKAGKEGEENQQSESKTEKKASEILKAECENASEMSTLGSAVRSIDEV